MGTIYDTTYAGMAPSLSARMMNLAPRLAATGITAVKYPPTVNTKNPYSLGYDPRTDLDWGQFEPLHITGSAQDLKASIDALHAVGLEAYPDIVNRQYGGPAPMYERGANGKIDYTLFPKYASCFAPPQAPDTPFRPNNGKDDGILASYEHTNGYMTRGKIQAAMLAKKVFGWDGLARIDEAKGLPIAFTTALNAALGGQCVAEVWSNQIDLQAMVQQAHVNVLDFPGHYAYVNVSKGGSLRQLVWSSYASVNPSRAVVFVENNDTDGENGVVERKLLCYVHALTIPSRAAMIFGKDWEVYNLGKWLGNIAWFAAATAYGNITYPIQEDGFLAWYRDGDGGDLGWSGGMLAAISNDPINWQSRWMPTPFAPGTRLKNFAPTLATATPVNQDRWTLVSVPPDYKGDGLSYGLFADERLQGWKPQPKPITKNGTGDFFNFSSITTQMVG